MVSHQISTLVAIALAASSAAFLYRLSALELSSTYPALRSVLITQIAITVLSFVIGIRTDLYESAFPVLLVAEWIVYGFMMREIYAAIFSDYPGIALLGRASVYGALAGTILVAGISIFSALKTFSGLESSLPYVETAAHCFTTGFGLLIAIILVAISRYPLRLHRNVFLNALLFGAILLGEAAGLIADLFLLRANTGWVNVAVSVNAVIWFSVWPILLTREDQTPVLRIRPRINSMDENRLLGELNAISTMILRATGK